MAKFDLSIIIPVFNEENNVVPLYKEINLIIKKINLSTEIIFVDDGSIDKTFGKLKQLKGIKIIQLRKNSGQAAALDAGIKHSRGKILVTLDGDGQNPPKEIPKLLAKIKEGYDVVCGWRYKRQDSFSKKVVSLGAAILKKILFSDKIHDSVCGLKAYKKECFENLDLYGEMHRMILELLEWQGFRITEVRVNHRPRKYGQSKYNWKRIIKSFLDMIYVWFWRKYESRPMHVFGTLGLVLASLGSVLLFSLAIARLFFSYYLSNKIWPLVGFFSVIMGGQFFIFGILASIIIQNQKRKSFYLIKKIIKK